MRAANPLSPNDPDHVPQRGALPLPSPDPPGRGHPPCRKAAATGATAPTPRASQVKPDDRQAMDLPATLSEWSVAERVSGGLASC